MPRNKINRTRDNKIYVDPLKPVKPETIAPSTDGRLMQLALFVSPFNIWITEVNVGFYNPKKKKKREQDSYLYPHPIRIVLSPNPIEEPKVKGRHVPPKWLVNLQEIILTHQHLHESIQKPGH